MFVIILWKGTGIYMKKNTINRILIAIIALLIVTICILIYKIASRPQYAFTEQNNQSVGSNTVTNVEIPEISASTIFEQSQSTAEHETQKTNETTVLPNVSDTLHGKTSDRVNIRELPSEEARVLETVDAGYTFDIIEIYNDDWVKIRYQEQEAYISTMYVILLPN